MQIFVEGAIQDSYSADVAVDDFSLGNGICTGNAPDDLGLTERLLLNTRVIISIGLISALIESVKAKSSTKCLHCSFCTYLLYDVTIQGVQD